MGLINTLEMQTKQRSWLPRSHSLLSDEACLSAHADFASSLNRQTLRTATAAGLWKNTRPVSTNAGMPPSLLASRSPVIGPRLVPTENRQRCGWARACGFHKCWIAL